MAQLLVEMSHFEQILNKLLAEMSHFEQILNKMRQRAASNGAITCGNVAF
jgi:hypothetical protein